MNNWTELVALVVEDSAVQRAHLVELVKSLSFGTVLEACNGVDALRVLESVETESVYLVLTDLDMPVMDGIELIRHLTEFQLAKNVIVTSARDPRLLETIEKMGSDDPRLHLLGTVVKPVKLDDLIIALSRAGQITRQNSSKPNRSPFRFDEFEAALMREQFIPFFQPKISMASGLVNGVEALARWQHPEHGLLSPIHFIPRIEGTSLMAPLTFSIVDQVMRQLAIWHRAGLTSITVSINLSAENLADPAFIGRLVGLTNAYGVAPESLIWEVTETMVMSNLSQCLANLARLRLKGYGLAMDDYGIGYSSMQQLSRCPFSELKIDRFFVNGASERPHRRAILESLIEMGHRLGITTVAEGVETLPDWTLLQELGCDFAQGYLIAKPMAPVELPNWIEANRLRQQSAAGLARLS
jgi:EAL domain-containing protein (putative c-di-GMP-specific phosphodiesterase class I)/AmiR/NasT family two-component response regulator